MQIFIVLVLSTMTGHLWDASELLGKFLRVIDARSVVGRRKYVPSSCVLGIDLGRTSAVVNDLLVVFISYLESVLVRLKVLKLPR